MTNIQYATPPVVIITVMMPIMTLSPHAVVSISYAWRAYDAERIIKMPRMIVNREKGVCGIRFVRRSFIVCSVSLMGERTKKK